jgi:hypothetical protein
MKKFIPGILIVLLLSVGVFAQKQKTSPDAEQEVKPVKKQNNKKSQPEGGVLLDSGTSIEATLQQTLDVKNASVGDEVVLKTTKAIKQNGQTVVQKGARLIGRVTEVQQKTKDNAQSRLGVIFERIEGKNLSAPLSATIVSITQANAATTVGDTLDADVMGSSQTSGGVSRSNSSGGGGLLGGVTSTVGGVVNTTTNTVGGVTNTATSTVSGTTNTLGRTLNGIRLTQSSSTSANGATTLSTPNKNLRLEKGVTFQLRLNQSIEN